MDQQEVINNQQQNTYSSTPCAPPIVRIQLNEYWSFGISDATEPCNALVILQQPEALPTDPHVLDLFIRTNTDVSKMTEDRVEMLRVSGLVVDSITCEEEEEETPVQTDLLKGEEEEPRTPDAAARTSSFNFAAFSNKKTPAIDLSKITKKLDEPTNLNLESQALNAAVSEKLADIKDRKNKIGILVAKRPRFVSLDSCSPIFLNSLEI